MVKTTNQIINHKHTYYIAYCKGLHPNNYNIMFNVSKAINHWFDGFNPTQKAYMWGWWIAWLPLIIELHDGKIYRKPLYLMVKTMVSCKFSLKPIHWINRRWFSNRYHNSVQAQQSQWAQKQRQIAELQRAVTWPRRSDSGINEVAENDDIMGT